MTFFRYIHNRFAGKGKILSDFPTVQQEYGKAAVLMLFLLGLIQNVDVILVVWILKKTSGENQDKKKGDKTL